jgi:hypothetical protein
MPLKCGKQNIGKNIGELRRSGRPQKQAVAIALSFSRRCANPNTRGTRGMKKCVINQMSHAMFDDPKTARKAISRALKTCKRKLL